MRPASPAAPVAESTPAPTDRAPYRYVTCVPGICGERPIIQGTRTTIKAIVGYYKAEQLALAADQQSALFTFNTVDFLLLHRAWLATGRIHWGIIVCEQLPPGETIRRLLHLLNRVTADEMRNQVYWLPG